MKIYESLKEKTRQNTNKSLKEKTRQNTNKKPRIRKVLERSGPLSFDLICFISTKKILNQQLQILSD